MSPYWSSAPEFPIDFSESWLGPCRPPVLGAHAQPLKRLQKKEETAINYGLTINGEVEMGVAPRAFLRPGGQRSSGTPNFPKSLVNNFHFAKRIAILIVLYRRTRSVTMRSRSLLGFFFRCGSLYPVLHSDTIFQSRARIWASVAHLGPNYVEDAASQKVVTRTRKAYTLELRGSVGWSRILSVLYLIVVACTKLRVNT